LKVRVPGLAKQMEFMNYSFLREMRPVQVIKALFFCAVLALAALAWRKYPGSAYAYLLFTFSFNTLLLAGFIEKRIFFDTFIGLFLWLGFWFKLSVTLVFFNGSFGEPAGIFDFTGPAYDRALLVSSLAALALLCSGLFRRMFFSYSPVRASAPVPAVCGLYSRYKKRFWFFFMAAIVVVAISNVWLGIYQRGLVPRTVLPFGLSGVYPLLLLFGLASFSAILLDCEFRTGSAPYAAALLAIAEGFFSNVSMLSRGMILNGAALAIGAEESVRRRGRQIPVRFTFAVLAVFSVLFAGSVYTANRVRSYAFADGSPEQTAVVEAAAPSRARTLRFAVDRWVGLEGVMAVSSYSGLGRSLWENAWRERFSSTGTSLYDSTVLAVNNSYSGSDMTRKHFIVLPGIVAFFFYPGSFAFLFFGMFIAGLLGALLEMLVYKLAGGNLILCALLAQVAASRFAHFGYVPRQSYLLVFGIFIAALAAYAANKAGERFGGCDGRA